MVLGAFAAGSLIGLSVVSEDARQRKLGIYVLRCKRDNQESEQDAIRM